MEQKEEVEYWFDVEFLFNGYKQATRFDWFMDAMKYAVKYVAYNPQVYLYERRGEKTDFNAVCWSLDRPLRCSDFYTVMYKFQLPEQEAQK